MHAKILIVTTTRADWGILSPLAHALEATPGIQVDIAAGNMHVLSQYGHTVDIIRSEGFERIFTLDAPETDGTAASRSVIAAATLTGVARILQDGCYKAVIVLGDRYEITGAATAALIAGVPLVHLHGGEISAGAIDDAVRNSVSQMASLHLTATAGAARRLVSMGIDPATVVHTGAIGVQNALSTSIMPVEELAGTLGGFTPRRDDTLLVTYHPVTRDPDGLGPAEQTSALLQSLDMMPDIHAIITYPNNDTGSEAIIRMLVDFASKNPGRILLVPNLGQRRYFSAMYNVLAVVGNTSSGILEAPSTTAYTIDIGPRQNGRERALSVIHTGANAQEITAAVRKLQTCPPPHAPNPYYRPDAVTTAVNAIIDKCIK